MIHRTIIFLFSSQVPMPFFFLLINSSEWYPFHKRERERIARSQCIFYMSQHPLSNTSQHFNGNKTHTHNLSLRHSKPNFSKSKKKKKGSQAQTQTNMAVISSSSKSPLPFSVLFSFSLQS